MKQSAAAQSNAGISLRGERIVVAGGTQGIGEGVAYRFAKAGAEVWIIGRNEGNATTILEKLNEISKEQKTEPVPEHYFLKADLSLVSEAKRVAEAIRVRAGTQGVDYLVMTQGGPPNGTFVPTAESYDQHYAVQILSRFILAYELASDPGSSTIRKGVMSIMAPGKSFGAVDPDDLPMFKARDEGRYGILSAGSRDSAVMDSFIEDLAARNPNVNFTHIFPGTVKTNAASNSAMPWYIALPISVILTLAGTYPEAYAEVPFYLLANPEGRAFAAKEKFSDEKVLRVEPTATTKDEKFRSKVWDHLVKIASSK